MKKTISLLIVVFVLCASFTSCVFDDTSVKAELVGTWMYKADPFYAGDYYIIHESCYVFYSNGKYYTIGAQQYYYRDSGKVLGEPHISEYNGTYKIKKDCIEIVYSDGDKNELSYLWNDVSGKITKLGGGFVKVSNSTNYLDNLIK